MRKGIAGLSEYCPSEKRAASEIFLHTPFSLRPLPARSKTRLLTFHGFRVSPEQLGTHVPRELNYLRPDLIDQLFIDTEFIVFDNNNFHCGMVVSIRDQ